MLSDGAQIPRSRLIFGREYEDWKNGPVVILESYPLDLVLVGEIDIEQPGFLHCRKPAADIAFLLPTYPTTCDTHTVCHDRIGRALCVLGEEGRSKERGLLRREPMVRLYPD
jgi:hypothetical protein